MPHRDPRGVPGFGSGRQVGGGGAVTARGRGASPPWLSGGGGRSLCAQAAAGFRRWGAASGPPTPDNSAPGGEPSGRGNFSLAQPPLPAPVSGPRPCPLSPPPRGHRAGGRGRGAAARGGVARARPRGRLGRGPGGAGEPWGRRPAPRPRPRSGTGTTWTAASPATASASPSACGSAPPPAGSPPTRCNGDASGRREGGGRVCRGGRGAPPPPADFHLETWKEGGREGGGGRQPGIERSLRLRGGLKSDRTSFRIPRAGRLAGGQQEEAGRRSAWGPGRRPRVLSAIVSLSPPPGAVSWASCKTSEPHVPHPDGMITRGSDGRIKRVSPRKALRLSSLNILTIAPARPPTFGRRQGPRTRLSVFLATLYPRPSDLQRGLAMI